MNDVSFFSGRLLITAPDGSHGSFTGSALVEAFDDRIEINKTRIYYQYLTELRVFGNVLHIGYGASDGKQVENFFRYDTFLPGKGKIKLRDMAQRVATAREKLVKPSIAADQQAKTAEKPVRSELLPQRDNWHRAAVYSAMVAFPAICPACLKPAEVVGRLPLSAGMQEKGSWLVPACRQHASTITKSVRATNWRPDNSRLEFAFARGEYAGYFVTANSGQADEALRRQRESAPLLYAIRNGTHVVIYQYAVSFVLISTLQPSPIYMLRPDQNRILRGLPFSAASLLAGWWGIPAGPIFTIGSVIRNFRGGIDLTGTVLAVLSGDALAGGGY